MRLKICGLQAIAAFLNGADSMGISKLKLTTEEISGFKEAVVEIGICELFVEKGVSIGKENLL